MYEQLRQKHNPQNLFNDPEFPPNERSLYYTQKPPRGVTWKRPHQICTNPEFVVGEASRFDLDQGYLGKRI